MSPCATRLYAALDNNLIRFVDLYSARNEIAANSMAAAATKTATTTSRSSSNSGVTHTPASFVGHTGAVTSVALSLDGSLLVSGSVDGTARVWDTFSGELPRVCAACV